jgi:uncharacterized protein
MPLDSFPPPKQERLAHRSAIRILAQHEDSGSLDLELGQSLLLKSAYNGDIEVVDKLLKIGVSLDAADKVTGMTALHLAVGRDHLALARFLVERGASFVLDKQDRMPTIIAAECEVSEELCDFIAEAEARAEGV